MLLFVLARRVDRHIHRGVAAVDEVVGDQPVFEFFSANVGKQVVIDHDAGRELLTAALLHFGSELGVLDNVLLFEGKIIFGQDGANAIAPATGGLQVGSDVRFFHEW